MIQRNGLANWKREYWKLPKLSRNKKNLNLENYETLMKGTEDDTKRWKVTLFSWIGRINIVKNDYTTQGNPQIQHNPYQNTNGIFFTKLEQIILEFIV